MSRIPSDRESEGVALIRALCTVAGDESAVRDLLSRYSEHVGLDRFLTTASIALMLTFARCLPHPIDPDTCNKETR